MRRRTLAPYDIKNTNEWSSKLNINYKYTTLNGDFFGEAEAPEIHTILRTLVEAQDIITLTINGGAEPITVLYLDKNNNPILSNVLTKEDNTCSYYTRRPSTHLRIIDNEGAEIRIDAPNILSQSGSAN